jgi:acyl homoserine lactone synthase
MQAQVKSYSATIFVGWQDRNGVADHQRFRKQLFVDTLGWKLTHRNGREFDEFDTNRAIYCLLCRDAEPVGGWRALRTTEEYLSRKVFPELAPLRAYPSRPDVWEISRLGVLPRRAGAVSASLVYALMVHFAATRGARSLVGVVDVVHARNMAMAGLNIRAFKDPQDVGVDRLGHPISAFLAEMRLAEQGGARFERLMKCMESLEMRDEASLLGPESISA